MKYKNDKGQAGLTILLSIVVTLFVIGLLVFIFAIMGGKLSSSDTLYVPSGTNVIANETLAGVTERGVALAVSGYRSVSCSVNYCANSTGTVIIPATNYTATSCRVATKTGTLAQYNNTAWKCTYSYSYLADSGAVGVINDTNASISSVTDWFDIFLVIGAMVVLILLVVIIITAIKSSGLVGGEQVAKANNVGTA